MKSVCLALTLLFFSGAPAALPQDKPASGQSVQLKFVELKHLMNESQRLDRVIAFMRSLYMSPQIIYDSQLKTLALKGTTQEIARAEELLKQFDVPAAASRSRLVQITIHLIEASSQAGQTAVLPANINSAVENSAVEQLRTAFGYKSFRLMDTIMLQGREGSHAELSGLLPSTATRSSETPLYSARYQSVGYIESQKTLFVNGFRFNIKIPISHAEQITYVDSSVETDLSIRDDQKLVLGKLTRDQMAGNGVFLVLTAKVD